MGGRGASSGGAKAGGATKAAAASVAKAGGAIVNAATGVKSKILAGAGNASAAVANQLGAQAAAGQKTLDQLIAEAGGAVSPTLKAATRGPVPAGAAFAEIANKAAASVPMTARFSPSKVFISDAFKGAKKSAPSLTMADFASGLLAEARAGRISLSRADLIGAMDPGKVESSRIESPATGGVFHFIVDRSKK